MMQSKEYPMYAIAQMQMKWRLMTKYTALDNS